MNCADMILDSVDVANLAGVNLSVMVESGVNFPKFTWLVAITQPQSLNDTKWEWINLSLL